MAYIGKEPQIGNYSVLDALTASSTNSYTMQLSSTNFTPESANHLIVSLNGVIQKPGSSFTVSGSTITFVPSSGTLSSSDSIDFIIALGNVLDLGTPSDNTVSTSKIVDGAVTSAKLNAGKILQVISVTKTDTFQASLNNSYTDVTGLAATITPVSSSNKIFVTCSINYGSTTSFPPVFRLYRASTMINTGVAASDRPAASTAPMQQGQNADKNRGMHATINFLDSPSSTSATTYKIEGGVLQSSGILMVNTSGTSFDVDYNYIARTASTITLMEVSA